MVAAGGTLPWSIAAVGRLPCWLQARLHRRHCPPPCAPRLRRASDPDASRASKLLTAVRRRGTPADSLLLDAATSASLVRAMSACFDWPVPPPVAPVINFPR